MLCKESASGETITCKLRTRKEEKSKKISFLSMGKHDAWKLYQVTGEDNVALKAMLAYTMWNYCSEEDRYDVPCRLVELIDNNMYKGLYILRPRTDDDYFGLDDASKVLKTEEKPKVVEKNSRSLYEVYNPVNIYDYALWIQATCSFPGIFDDAVIVTDENNQNYFVPGKPEYVYGSYPKRYSWMNYNSEKRVISSVDFGIEDDETFETIVGNRWEEARKTYLSNSSLESTIESWKTDLFNTGFMIRHSVSADDIDAFQNAIELRYAYVDDYYRRQK